MTILYLTLDPPLDPAVAATGNQVRARGIIEALERAGHRVIQVCPVNENIPSSAGTYRTDDELADMLDAASPDAILVGYWSLLHHLPQTSTPVILDFIAPRMLELMFQEPDNVSERTAEIIELLHRADHFLVGNNKQSDLLLPLLLQSGFDCRSHIPVSVVSISVRERFSVSLSSLSELRLVNAGVDWPWRNAGAYRKTLQKIASENEQISFVEYSGDYPGNRDSESGSTLLGYAEMQKALARNHIGLELGARNTEREFSHSFRAMEYFECGLPVIINSWIPLAEQVEAYGAGWVIDSPDELEPLLNRIMSDPEEMDSKRMGVQRLKQEQLSYNISCQPLLDYLKAPERPGRIARISSHSHDFPEKIALEEFQEKPSAEEVSSLKVFLGVLFKTFFCPKRPGSTPDILMVSRSDLFPVDHGAAVKIIRTAESLSRQDRDVWLATDSRSTYYRFSNGEMFTHHYPWFIRFLCLPRILAFARLMIKGYPVSNHFLYLPVTDISYTVRALYLTSRKPIGAYQAEFPAYVRPCRFARSLFGGKVLLVQHNVEYDRIKNQVPELTEKNYYTLKNLEVAMCHLADNIVAVSDNDRRKMIEDGIDGDKIHTIPHGVDLHAFRETTPINIHAHYGIPAGSRVLVYHGTYSYPPNLQSMEVMANEILPRLAERGVQVSVLAIGSKPPDFPLHPDIYFAGSVDDLAEVIPAADLAVVPLLDGGGTRMKILDYFAAGVPVISTAKGIEGIPVSNSREAIIVDDWDQMCDHIERLLDTPDEATAMREAAATFVDSLGWDAIARRYLPLLK